MATDKQSLQAREGHDLAPAREATRPGVLITTPVDIFEDANSLTVLADMPGVKSADLSIDLHDGVLTITGHAGAPESPNEAFLLHEYGPGTFQRSFALSEVIDQAKIQATLKHGVLRLRLPKAEQAKPRQIRVKAD